MKAIIKLPEGYRKLGWGEVMKKGDLFLDTNGPDFDPVTPNLIWSPVVQSLGIAPEGQMYTIRKRKK